MQPDFSERYSRQLRLQGFGQEAQEKLAAAAVLVVGAGGLGVPVLQYLTGMGVGRIGIVDDDPVSLSNLHRQVLYDMDDLGKPKAAVAAAKLTRLNPGIDLRPVVQRLTAACALELIEGYDVVVDATDNFAARYAVNDACVALRTPFVYGAVQGYEGHVSVFNLDGGPAYRCLYPEAPEALMVPDCSAAGVLGVVPGIIGTMQALQVVKLLTGIGKTLSGYLQVYDFRDDTQYKVKLKTNLANQRLTALPDIRPEGAGAGHFVPPDIVATWLQDGKTFLLADVREPAEFDAGHIPSAQNVPLSGLLAPAAGFAAGTPVVLYCQGGRRSATAFSALHVQHPELELFELTGGFDAWIHAQRNS